MATEVRKNPWLGLKSYSEGEVLYGRDDDIRELTQCVLGDKDTLLYGKSGIGKSSILNAGVVPAAERQGYLPVPIRLDHKNSKDYLAQIKEEIVFQLTKRLHDPNAASGIVEVVKRKNADHESIYEYFHRHIFQNLAGERIKLLLIFDQFEEIFTLQENEHEKKRFFSELADFLNDIVPGYLQTEILELNTNMEEVSLHTNEEFSNLFDDLQIDEERNAEEYVTDNEIHMVFTIREDFLSEFEYYTAAIPSLKHNRYGLRPLNEEQAAQIILRPIPNLVSIPVAKLIIEKITNKTDFDLNGVPELEVDSAVLSLYLNRLYEAKTGDIITEELVEEKGNGIIQQFYQDAIEKISPQTVDFLEERLLNSQSRRDNISEYDAIHEGHVKKNELKELCDGDLKILRKFYLSGDMRIEYIHDILCPIVKAHKEERKKQKEEEQERIRQEEEKQRLLAEERAKREKIEQEARLEQERLKEEAEQLRIKTKRGIRRVVFAVICVLLVIAIYLIGYKIPYSESYVTFTTVNGWPVGVGKPIGKVLEVGKRTGLQTKIDVPQKEEGDFSVIYKLSRKGAFSGRHFDNVEVLTPSGEPTTNIFIETPAVGLLESELNDVRAQKFAKLQKRVSSWRYFPSSNGDVGSCMAFDSVMQPLYSIRYYRDNSLVSSDPAKYTQWATFYDGSGKPMAISTKGTDRMRQTIQNGLLTGCVFFTEYGVPQLNAFGAYGYAYEVDSITKQVKRRYNVNKFGDKIDSTAVDYFYDQYGRVKETSFFKVYYPQKGMIVYQFEHFNDTLQYNMNGSLKYGTFHTPRGEYSKIVFKYDEHNRPLMNKKFKGQTLVEATEYSYLEASNQYDSISYFKNGISYVERYTFLKTNTMVITVWRGNKKVEKSEIVDEYSRREFKYHLCKTTTMFDSVYSIISVEYQDTLGRLITQDKGLYARRETYKLKNGNVKLEYFYDCEGAIYKSEWFGYDEYGNRNSRAVAGIEGTPVRCPEWDWNGLCFYRMNILYPFKQIDRTTYVSAQGIDEFGFPSYISRMINGEWKYLSISEVDDQYVMSKNLTGVAIAKTEFEDAFDFRYPACCVLLLSKEGTGYKYGLKDGDIVLRKLNTGLSVMRQPQASALLSRIQQNGGVIWIARPNSDTKQYDIKQVSLPKGTMHIRFVSFGLTQQEDDILNKSLIY
ncbi:MAG: hypothetical protein IJ047_00580 [Paludibacteraceae bacterium]|nr:hypothetical protein [Paludibacteraceae bacterium]